MNNENLYPKLPILPVELLLKKSEELDGGIPDSLREILAFENEFDMFKDMGGFEGKSEIRDFTDEVLPVVGSGKENGSGGGGDDRSRDSPPAKRKMKQVLNERLKHSARLNSLAMHQKSLKNTQNGQNRRSSQSHVPRRGRGIGGHQRGRFSQNQLQIPGNSPKNQNRDFFISFSFSSMEASSTNLARIREELEESEKTVTDLGNSKSRLGMSCILDQVNEAEKEGLEKKFLFNKSGVPIIENSITNPASAGNESPGRCIAPVCDLKERTGAQNSSNGIFGFGGLETQNMMIERVVGKLEDPEDENHPPYSPQSPSGQVPILTLALPKKSRPGVIQRIDLSPEPPRTAIELQTDDYVYEATPLPLKEDVKMMKSIKNRTSQVKIHPFVAQSSPKKLKKHKISKNKENRRFRSFEIFEPKRDNKTLDNLKINLQSQMMDENPADQRPTKRKKLGRLVRNKSSTKLSKSRRIDAAELQDGFAELTNRPTVGKKKEFKNKVIRSPQTLGRSNNISLASSQLEMLRDSLPAEGGQVFKKNQPRKARNAKKHSRPLKRKKSQKTVGKKRRRSRRGQRQAPRSSELAKRSLNALSDSGSLEVKMKKNGRKKGSVGSRERKAARSCSDSLKKGLKSLKKSISISKTQNRERRKTRDFGLKSPQKQPQKPLKRSLYVPGRSQSYSNTPTSDIEKLAKKSITPFLEGSKDTRARNALRRTFENSYKSRKLNFRKMGIDPRYYRSFDISANNYRDRSTIEALRASDDDQKMPKKCKHLKLKFLRSRSQFAIKPDSEANCDALDPNWRLRGSQESGEAYEIEVDTKIIKFEEGGVGGGRKALMAYKEPGLSCLSGEGASEGASGGDFESRGDSGHFEPITPRKVSQAVVRSVLSSELTPGSHSQVLQFQDNLEAIVRRSPTLGHLSKPRNSKKWPGSYNSGIWVNPPKNHNQAMGSYPEDPSTLAPLAENFRNHQKGPKINYSQLDEKFKQTLKSKESKPGNLFETLQTDQENLKNAFKSMSNASIREKTQKIKISKKQQEPEKIDSRHHRRSIRRPFSPFSKSVTNTSRKSAKKMDQLKFLISKLKSTLKDSQCLSRHLSKTRHFSSHDCRSLLTQNAKEVQKLPKNQRNQKNQKKQKNYSISNLAAIAERERTKERAFNHEDASVYSFFVPNRMEMAIKKKGPKFRFKSLELKDLSRLINSRHDLHGSGHLDVEIAPETAYDNFESQIYEFGDESDFGWIQAAGDAKKARKMYLDSSMDVPGRGAALGVESAKKVKSGFLENFKDLEGNLEALGSGIKCKEGRNGAGERIGGRKKRLKAALRLQGQIRQKKGLVGGDAHGEGRYCSKRAGNDWNSKIGGNGQSSKILVPGSPSPKKQLRVCLDESPGGGERHQPHSSLLKKGSKAKKPKIEKSQKSEKMRIFQQTEAQKINQSGVLEPNGGTSTLNISLLAQRKLKSEKTLNTGYCYLDLANQTNKAAKAARGVQSVAKKRVSGMNIGIKRSGVKIRKKRSRRNLGKGSPGLSGYGSSLLQFISTRRKELSFKPEKSKISKNSKNLKKSQKSICSSSKQAIRSKMICLTPRKENKPLIAKKIDLETKNQFDTPDSKTKQNSDSESLKVFSVGEESSNKSSIFSSGGRDPSKTDKEGKLVKNYKSAEKRLQQTKGENRSIYRPSPRADGPSQRKTAAKTRNFESIKKNVCLPGGIVKSSSKVIRNLRRALKNGAVVVRGGLESGKLANCSGIDFSGEFKTSGKIECKRGGFDAKASTVGVYGRGELSEGGLGSGVRGKKVYQELPFSKFRKKPTKQMTHLTHKKPNQRKPSKNKQLNNPSTTKPTKSTTNSTTTTSITKPKTKTAKSNSISSKISNLQNKPTTAQRQNVRVSQVEETQKTQKSSQKWPSSTKKPKIFGSESKTQNRSKRLWRGVSECSISYQPSEVTSPQQKGKNALTTAIKRRKKGGGSSSKKKQNHLKQSVLSQNSKSDRSITGAGAPVGRSGKAGYGDSSILGLRTPKSVSNLFKKGVHGKQVLKCFGKDNEDFYDRKINCRGSNGSKRLRYGKS